MSEIFGAYSFLPWLRQGVARTITAADKDPAVRTRASANVELLLTGDALEGPRLESRITRNVELYGPGEIVGVERRAISRVEPRDWITDFEPNYLAQIEFYDEDFAWRYTPAAASGLNVRPWLALVVLKETDDPATSEFREARALARRPAAFISVKDFSPFPNADELWAWAHVHVNQALGASPSDITPSDLGAAMGRFTAALNANRDIAHSRILCPRRLEENAAYHAFLVPTFERGRLAGLGLDPDLAPFATASAWANYAGRPEGLNMPYYHRWYFRTGGAGDFESLVRLLQPRTADPRVGRREIDVQWPGSNMPAVEGINGVLRLGGALRAPLITLDETKREEYHRFEDWAKASYPTAFQRKLAGFINLADSYTNKPADAALADAGLAAPDDVDPLIAPPIYGEWQALQHRLLNDAAGAALANRSNWIHTVNLDPRHRVAGNFGGDVVRTHQEDYMEAAWLQVGDVIAHNRKMRAAKTWIAVNHSLYTKAVVAAQATPTRALSLMAPMQARVMSGRFTMRHALRTSETQPVLVSPMMRRAARPHGPLGKALGLARAPDAKTLLEAVNEGRITAAPPKTAPSGVTTVEDLAAATKAAGGRAPEWLAALLRAMPWLFWLLLIAALAAGAAAALLAPALVSASGLGALAAGLLALAFSVRALQQRPRLDDVLGDNLDAPDVAEKLPPAPNFRFGGRGPRRGGVGGDNAQARQFKAALTRWTAFAAEAETAAREPALQRLDLRTEAGGAVSAVRPAVTIAKRFLSTVKLAPHVEAQAVETFDEIRYYPRIDVAMYAPLRDMSEEAFTPNLNLLEPNSLTALETNQAFIEAYMVGVNHEFSRELLWREYPTDQRGTSFRQFWDVSAQIAPGMSESARRKLYDIPPIHQWPRASALGAHDNRQEPGAPPRDEIVLAVRGELLKKYPTTVIYAHKAEWGATLADERSLIDIAPEEMEEPPKTKALKPLYEAKVSPDIYLFGFELTAEQARGGSALNEDAGWFFVLKERPGDPRFGLDTKRDADNTKSTVNDLSWEDVPGAAPGAMLAATALAAPGLTAPGPDEDEKIDQHNEDVRVAPLPASAARWAYVLYQSPVMVAVHAAEMLKPNAP